MHTHLRGRGQSSPRRRPRALVDPFAVALRSTFEATGQDAVLKYTKRPASEPSPFDDSAKRAFGVFCGARPGTYDSWYVLFFGVHLYQLH